MIVFLDVISGFIVILILIVSAHNHFARKRPIITKENGYMFDSYSDDDGFSSNFSFGSDYYWSYDNINDNNTSFDYDTYSTTDSDYNDWTMDPAHSYSICNVYHISEPNND